MAEIDWITPMVECLRGQIDMMYAISDLVDLDRRGELLTRADRHEVVIAALLARSVSLPDRAGDADG